MHTPIAVRLLAPLSPRPDAVAMTAGSHRDLSDNTLFTEEADVMSLVDDES